MPSVRYFSAFNKLSFRYTLVFESKLLHSVTFMENVLDWPVVNSNGIFVSVVALFSPIITSFSPSVIISITGIIASLSQNIHLYRLFFEHAYQMKGLFLFNIFFNTFSFDT